ncbi:hypothetical protein [Micromonospora sp. 050-3]|uniref:hypothetical protein n=1 Tax=Micromonospora sp. 050-3 TaxID=2789265 RepID=UPI00397A9D95
MADPPPQFGDIPLWRSNAPSRVEFRPWQQYRRRQVGVHLRRWLWEYFGDHQHKITRSFPVVRWLDQDTHVPARDPKTLAALAEAVALVAYGRSPEGRAGLAAAIAGEPTIRQPWVRSLVTELRRPITARQT